MLNQDVFIRGWRTSQNSKTRPHFVEHTLGNFSFCISDPFVEFFAFHDKEIISRLYDATFEGNWSGSINIVSGHHTDGDTCTLALSYGWWNFITNWIFDSNYTQTSQAGNDCIFIIPVWFTFNLSFIWCSWFPMNIISVRYTNGTKTIWGHRLNYCLYQSILFFSWESFQFSIFAINKHTLFENNFRCSFTEYSESFFTRQVDHGAHILSDWIERVYLLDFVLGNLITFGLVVFTESNYITKKTTFSLVTNLLCWFSWIVWRL